MKNFMKSCAIAAAVLIVLGMVLTSVIGRFRSREVVEDLVESVSHGKLELNLKPFELYIPEGKVSDHVHYDLGDAVMFDSDFEIYKGDVEKYALGSDVRKIKVEIGGCDFCIKPSGDEKYYVEAENTKKFQGYINNETLHIRSIVNSTVAKADMDCKIVLYVPENWGQNELEKIEVELGAGKLQMDRIVAEKVKLSVGAGEIYMYEVNADDVDVAVGMGDVRIGEMDIATISGEVGMGVMHLHGAIGAKADLECAMGSLEMEIAGSQEDFDYKLNCGMGNISVGSESYGGIAQEKKLDNNASKKMTLECAMGDVRVAFTR